MVVFRTAYYNAMDREGYKSTDDLGIGPSDIGMSVPFGIAGTTPQDVAAHMRMGAGAIELQFPGAGGGGRQALTPGQYGFDQRQALRELAKANEVKLTTHATWAMGGLSGRDQHGNFSEEQRKMGVDEVKRAIEFAADTAGSGSVVVHTDEFERPISEEEWARRREDYIFKRYKEEPERALVYVLDDRTGQVLRTVRKNVNVPRPVWNRATEDYDSVDEYGSPVHISKGDYIDYEGRKITDLAKRVPEFDAKTGEFRVELKDWKYFEDEAEERNREEARRLGINTEELKTYRDPKTGKMVWVTPEEAFIRGSLETQAEISRGWAGIYSRGIDDQMELLKKLKEKEKDWAEIEARTPEDKKWKLKEDVTRDGILRKLGVTVPEGKLPTEIIKEQIEALRKDIYSHQRMVTGQLEAAKEQEEMADHITSAKKYAVERATDSYAETGLYAMQQSGDKEKPLFVTLENVSPEQYGGHPSELKEIVLKSREKMADRLHGMGYSESEAKKLAEKHIKATLDTGHLNTWRKYYQGSDKEFRNWLLQQVEDLGKSGIIGNIHLSDNFGYHDSHLAPGQGITPVKEIVKILKKHGYKEALTVEPGADATTDLSAFHGLMKTWRYFGSPIYGAFEPAPPAQGRSWSDIQYSYFGRTYPPYFIFGAYAPSNEWTLWSGVPME